VLFTLVFTHKRAWGWIVRIVGGITIDRDNREGETGIGLSSLSCCAFPGDFPGFRLRKLCAAQPTIANDQLTGSGCVEDFHLPTVP